LCQAGSGEQARAGDMVIEANFHPYSEYELDKLRGLGDRIVEVHCACPAEIAVALLSARWRAQWRLDCRARVELAAA
jgi:hypothetical protein